jgi:hypothetical protein
VNDPLTAPPPVKIQTAVPGDIRPMTLPVSEHVSPARCPVHVAPVTITTVPGGVLGGALGVRTTVPAAA